MSPRVIFEQQYKTAAAEGAIVELRLRVLANKIPELRKFAHEQKLQNVETPIMQHFASALTEEEKSTLRIGAGDKRPNGYFCQRRSKTRPARMYRIRPLMSRRPEPQVLHLGDDELSRFLVGLY